jgi:hypothetical protein
MMTLENLKELPEHSVFATGISFDDRLFREPVRWVAKRGYIHDWAIYYGDQAKSVEEITKWGSKLYSRNIIKDLVVCDEEMMKMYRD